MQVMKRDTARETGVQGDSDTSPGLMSWAGVVMFAADEEEGRPH